MFQKASKSLYFSMLVWFAAVAGASLVLVDYSTKPGKLSVAPQLWPSETCIEFSNTEKNLIAFIHPRCPCSRATLEELNRLLFKASKPIKINLVFGAPEGATEAWVESDLWLTAKQLPFSNTVVDLGNVEATRFSSYTSGQVLLYDQSGLLRFNGGITMSRSHFGDNLGLAQLVSIVNETNSGDAEFSVYGCELFDSPPEFCRSKVGQ